MIKENFSKDVRPNKPSLLETDFVVAGGGLAGVCAAITAARAGTHVVLVQDRPVLGGNASSEVRLWALGATSHMGNNNRWSREGGVINEIMLDNQHQNPLGNALIFDALLLDKVVSEKNITLLLNTAVFQVNKSSDRQIESIDAFCSQNSLHYTIKAKQFCDATGDGLLAFNAGASFRIGSESRNEFNEGLAPEIENKDLLGHSLFFYSKKLDRPVSYTAPSFAYTHEEIGAMPRSKNINGDDSGCKFWWLEYGGILDTIYKTEDIKWELWKIVYGIWDYIKNSGKFDDVENLTLEWVGTVPGKRESRRFEGEYMLTQNDIVDQTPFDDAVSYGGWAIDIHPAEGVYSEKPACAQFHSKGVYPIPYRSFISKDIHNLFLAGRIISATHMAFGSTRVMITCAHGGQAVGEAAAMCHELNLNPKDLLKTEKMQALQQRLNLNGHGILGIPINTSGRLSDAANITASSTLVLNDISGNEKYLPLHQSYAQLIPFSQGAAPTINILVRALKETKLLCELRTSSHPENYTPDQICKKLTKSLTVGQHEIQLNFSEIQLQEQYGFICFMANEHIEIETSDLLITGTMSVANKVHKAVSNNGKQLAPANSGIEVFEFWTPERRPLGQNLALRFSPPINAYHANNLKNGHLRPWLKSNAWVSRLDDPKPTLYIKWDTPKDIRSITLYFDTDADHALETVLMEHPETRMPFCVKNYRITLANGHVLHETRENYQTINTIKFDTPLSTDTLIIELEHCSQHVPASLFELVIA